MILGAENKIITINQAHLSGTENCVCYAFLYLCMQFIELHITSADSKSIRFFNSVQWWFYLIMTCPRKEKFLPFLIMFTNEKSILTCGAGRCSSRVAAE